MIIFIDNKDSFVWNIVDYISMIDEDVKVVPNDISATYLRNDDPDAIIISPGPGTPYDKKYIGNSIEIVKEFDYLPILGICLGLEIISVAFGGKVELVRPVHGKCSLIYHDGKKVFTGIDNPFKGGRYHSLAVTGVPESFEVSARCDGVVMGIRSKKKDIEGYQFHPESILTDLGFDILRNWYNCYIK